jgi:hypothetical protein
MRSMNLHPRCLRCYNEPISRSPSISYHTYVLEEPHQPVKPSKYLTRHHRKYLSYSIATMIDHSVLINEKAEPSSNTLLGVGWTSRWPICYFNKPGNQERSCSPLRYRRDMKGKNNCPRSKYDSTIKYVEGNHCARRRENSDCHIVKSL